MRVIDIIEEYEKEHGHTFAKWHKQVVGGIIKKQYLQTYRGLTAPLALVPSTEPWGTFLVADYPAIFVSRMADIIYHFAELINEQKAKKISERSSEKPTKQLPEKAPASEPQKRTRKRIPIQRPAFSGKSTQTHNR